MRALLAGGPKHVRLDGEQQSRYTFAKTAGIILDEITGKNRRSNETNDD
jgi:hypothetical protein